MRCVYCHDLVKEDWIEMRPGELAHVGCAAVTWSYRRELVKKVDEADRRELSARDAQRMIHDWESELDHS